MIKTQLKFIITIVLVLGLSISLQSLLASWQAPTVGPPGGNIDRPINTGLGLQNKLGSLNIGTSLGANDFRASDRMAINSATSSFNRLKIIENNPSSGAAIYIEGNSKNPEIDLSDGTNHWGIYYDSQNTDELRFWHGGSNRFSLDTGGNLTANSFSGDGSGLVANDPTANNQIATKGYVDGMVDNSGLLVAGCTINGCWGGATMLASSGVSTCPLGTTKYDNLQCDDSGCWGLTVNFCIKN